VRTPLTLALVASLQLLAGFGFQLLALAALGLGPATDALLAAQAVPAVLTAVLAMALQSVWQPRLAVAGQASWHDTQRTAHAQALIAFGVVGLLLGASAPWWTRWLLAGLDTGTRAQVLQMTPPLLLASALGGAAAVLTAAERGRDRLISAELVALAGALLGLLLLMPALRIGGVVAAAYVLLLRAVLVWVALVVMVGGSAPRWRAAWNERATWRQLRPLVAGAGIYKSAPLVDRFWSALGPAGDLTLYGLAHSGMAALAAVFERAFAMPAGPSIARSVKAGEAEAVRRLYRRALLAVAAAAAFSALALLVLRPFAGGWLATALNLAPARADTLWSLCALLLGFLFVAAAGTAVVAVFYAMGDTRTPAAIGVAGFVVGVVAKSAGFLWLGIEGLALATSLYYLLNLVVLVVAVERRLAVRRAATLTA
jgi:putative peptidoglycan lipid II flippase